MGRPGNGLCSPKLNVRITELAVHAPSPYLQYGSLIPRPCFFQVYKVPLHIRKSEGLGARLYVHAEFTRIITLGVRYRKARCSNFKMHSFASMNLINRI